VDDLRTRRLDPCVLNSLFAFTLVFIVAFCLLFLFGYGA